MEQNKTKMSLYVQQISDQFSTIKLHNDDGIDKAKQFEIPILSETMVQNKTKMSLHVQQISDKFSTIQLHNDDGIDKAKQFENLNSTPDETNPFTIEQSKNIFSKSSSNSIEYSNTETYLKTSFCKCKYCGEQFERMSDFLVHKKSHTDERLFSHLPFKCHKCSLAFDSKRKLKNHKKTHPSPKPYKCNICSRCYLQSHSLINHFWISHGAVYQ